MLLNVLFSLKTTYL